MAMLKRILFAAGLAGLLAGIFMTGLQMIGTIPLILEAETYETAGAAGHSRDHDAVAVEGATAAPAEAGAEAEEWGPSDGFERAAYTLLFNILMGVGFGLLLAAALALTGETGWRRGLQLGLIGFASFILAPALGLPPEVPGAAAAPLADRQVWWLFTALSTAAGLVLMFRTQRWHWLALGIALVVLPHVVGAPQPEEHGGLAPARLAQDFIVTVLVTGFLFWLALGALSGFFYKRFATA